MDDYYNRVIKKFIKIYFINLVQSKLLIIIHPWPNHSGNKD